MTDAYTTTLERITQARDRTTSELSGRVAEAAQKDATARGTLPAGTRVFDTVSGIEGNVEASDRIVHAGSPLIPVRVASGGVVLRTLAQLVVRPTPPAGAR